MHVLRACCKKIRGEPAFSIPVMCNLFVWYKGIKMCAINRSYTVFEERIELQIIMNFQSKGGCAGGESNIRVVKFTGGEEVQNAMDSSNLIQ